MKRVFISTLVTCAFSLASVMGQIRPSLTSDSPWQILMSTLYSHGVDTVGLHVMSKIDSDILQEIIPDLAKSYKVKHPIDSSRIIIDNLGDVITEFMNAKYRKRGGEKYDYYKVRYSTRMYDYNAYFHHYPNSPYYEELFTKFSCLDQYCMWTTRTDNKGCQQMIVFFDVFPCPYDGFSRLMEENATYHKTVQDWNELMAEFDENGSINKERLEAFRQSHEKHLSGYYFVIKDLLKENRREIDSTEEKTGSSMDVLKSR